MKQAPLLHVTEYGTGRPVVLLHGFLSSSAYWKKVSELVSQDHRVIAVDLLGFGNSPKPYRSRYDYNAHIRSIRRTLLHYSIQDYVLIGHSMGALLALRYATLYPDDVRKLILANMPITLSKKQAKNEFYSTHVLYRLGLSPIFHYATWSIVKALYTVKLLPRRIIAMFNENKEYVFNHTAVSRIRSFQKIIVNSKVDVDLAALNVKTVLMSGVQDRAVYLSNLTSGLLSMPQVAVQTFHTGHHIPKHMPELIAQQIRD